MDLLVYSYVIYIHLLWENGAGIRISWPEATNSIIQNNEEGMSKTHCPWLSTVALVTVKRGSFLKSPITNWSPLKRILDKQEFFEDICGQLSADNGTFQVKLFF